MMGRKTASPKIDGAVERAVNYEITVADLARRSERRAWLVASGAMLMSLVLAGGYFYVLPLKEKVPYLIMADAYTGNATVARLRGDFNNNSITASEAVNRANIANFIRARESYDWTQIGARDWGTVFTMAEPQVASSYRELYSTRNPAGPLQVYGKKYAIRVKILSLQLFGGDPKKGPSGATVRFQRSLFEKAAGTSRFLDSKIATLEFSYKPNLAMSEEDRLLNPLGFRVSAYRVDNDYSATPSVDDETTVPAVTGAPAAGMPSAVPMDPVASALAQAQAAQLQAAQAQRAPAGMPGTPTQAGVPLPQGAQPALPAGSQPAAPTIVNEAAPGGAR
jgi:type IV secretion system protein VirB8